MPPKESRAQTRAKDRILEISNAHSKSNPRRTTPSIDVFRQLLTEASDPAKFEGPPRKRRRVGERDSIKDEPESKDLENTVNKIDHNKRENIIASDNDSDESDFTWEDVKVQEENASAHSENEVNDVQVEINPQTTPSKRQKRKGVTAADKQLAISIHKTHVLFLLFHVHVRNSWCNNPQVKVCVYIFVVLFFIILKSVYSQTSNPCFLPRLSVCSIQIQILFNCANLICYMMGSKLL